MMKCIFCLSTDNNKFNTIEHVIPESLGGGDWAVLKKGLFCDDCQNKFGSAIEQQALSMPPLSTFRTLFGVPTKKHKFPWFNYWEGKLISSGTPGIVSYEPKPIFKNAFESGKKTLTIVETTTKKPDMLLRTLLKIGLETFANDDDSIFDSKFDAARKYALTGMKENPWFYIQIENIKMLNNYLKEISIEDWTDNFFADVHDYSNLVYLHFKLLYLEFIVPLIDNVLPDEKLKAEFNKYEHRIIIV